MKVIAKVELTRAEIRELYNTIIANPEVISLTFDTEVDLAEDCPNCEQSPCICPQPTDDSESDEIKEAREFLTANGFI